VVLEGIWHAGARTWTPQSRPRERLAAQRRAASDEEGYVDRDPRARPAPGRAGLDGFPARRRRRWSPSAVWTPERAEDLRVSPSPLLATNGVSKGLDEPFQHSLFRYPCPFLRSPRQPAWSLQSRSQYVHHLFWRFPGQYRQYLMSGVSSHENLIGFGTGSSCPIDCRRVFGRNSLH
jgi:hypothetical protein